MSWLNRQSPSVTMSSPATPCSRRYNDSASTYCSRKREITIASRNDRVPRFSVYQLGRGSEPVIVVGSMIPAVAFNMTEESSLNEWRPVRLRLALRRDRPYYDRDCLVGPVLSDRPGGHYLKRQQLPSAPAPRP